MKNGWLYGKHTMYSKAFTLIEMLVVIGIIAVLASMLTPAMQQALDAAKGVQCSSNMHQINIAQGSYCNDNNGYYPPHFTGLVCGWRGLIPLYWAAM